MNVAVLCTPYVIVGMRRGPIKNYKESFLVMCIFTYFSCILIKYSYKSFGAIDDLGTKQVLRKLIFNKRDPKLKFVRHAWYPYLHKLQDLNKVAGPPERFYCINAF